MTVIEYLIASLGCVYIFTESVIFAPWRMHLSRAGTFFRVLAYCRACTGFWVGVCFGPASPFLHAGDPHPVWARRVMSGLFVMLLGYLWSKWLPNDAWDVEQGDRS